MRTRVFATLTFAILPTTMVLAFVPQMKFIPAVRPRPLLASTSNDDAENAIDIKHAKYCADHFGECSLEEMERIRNGESIVRSYICIIVICSTNMVVMYCGLG